MKQLTLIELGKLLEPEAYPYQKGLAQRFAKALLGDTEPLQEAYRCASGGQGANSRANFSNGILQLELTVPELLVDGIPFPISEGQEIVVRKIPVIKAKKIIEKFS